MDNDDLVRQLNELHFEHMKELVRFSSVVAAQGEDGLLLCLYAADRPMLSGELVERMGLTTGRVANILKMLEAKGFVDRAQDRTDRRKVHITLTEAGWQRAHARYAAGSETHRQLIEYLGAEDAQALIRLLERCFEYYADPSPVTQAGHA